MPRRFSLRSHWSIARRSNANDLNYDLAVPCPCVVRLPRWLGPRASRRKFLHGAFVELSTEANVYRSAEHDDSSVIGMRMWRNSKAARESPPLGIHSWLCVIANNVRSGNAARSVRPCQIVLCEA